MWQEMTYYSLNKNNAPIDVKIKCKQKFEPKVLLWIAISNKGISKPYLQVGGLAINQSIYATKCLKGKLLPFIRKYHSDDNYLFWPDLATAHYGKMSLEFLKSNNINFVEKHRNPPNVPQNRPIEDLFGYLSSIVYRKGWRAESTQQLMRRIKYCIKKSI